MTNTMSTRVAILGWLVFHIAGGLIHILLIVVIIVLAVNFFRGRT